MRYRISILRYSFETVLNWFGAGPRRSRFTPARNPETRVRFAQYVSRLQPPTEPMSARRTARLLGQGGAVSHGQVRHASHSEGVAPVRRPLFHHFTQPGGIAARRRANARPEGASLRFLFNALRAR